MSLSVRVSRPGGSHKQILVPADCIWAAFARTVEVRAPVQKLVACSRAILTPAGHVPQREFGISDFSLNVDGQPWRDPRALVKDVLRASSRSGGAAGTHVTECEKGVEIQRVQEMPLQFSTIGDGQLLDIQVPLTSSFDLVKQSLEVCATACCALTRLGPGLSTWLNTRAKALAGWAVVRFCGCADCRPAPAPAATHAALRGSAHSRFADGDDVCRSASHRRRHAADAELPQLHRPAHHAQDGVCPGPRACVPHCRRLTAAVQDRLELDEVTHFDKRRIACGDCGSRRAPISVKARCFECGSETILHLSPDLADGSHSLSDRSWKQLLEEEVLCMDCAHAGVVRVVAAASCCRRGWLTAICFAGAVRLRHLLPRPDRHRRALPLAHWLASGGRKARAVRPQGAHLALEWWWCVWRRMRRCLCGSVCVPAFVWHLSHSPLPACSGSPRQCL